MWKDAESHALSHPILKPMAQVLLLHPFNGREAKTQRIYVCYQEHIDTKLQRWDWNPGSAL